MKNINEARLLLENNYAIFSVYENFCTRNQLLILGKLPNMIRNGRVLFKFCVFGTYIPGVLVKILCHVILIHRCWRKLLIEGYVESLTAAEADFQQGF